MIDHEARTGFIETIGRRSGLPRETQIGFATDGARIFAIASHGDAADWVKNLRANPAVRFRIGETWHVGAVRIATDPEEEASIREAMLAKYTGGRIGTDWIRTGLALVIDPARP